MQSFTGWSVNLHSSQSPKDGGNPYITLVDGIHGQQVVSMAELEVDDLQGGLDLSQLSGLSRTALPHHVLQQQAVLTDPLHGLQQVGPQVHFVPELQLLLLVKGRGEQTCEDRLMCSAQMLSALCDSTS